MTLPLDLPIPPGEEVRAAASPQGEGGFAAAALPRLAQLGAPGWQLVAEFEVHGLPAPQGSKRAFVNKYSGRVQMVESSSKVASWRTDVKAAAETARSVLPDRLDGPLALGVVFTMPKPSSKPIWWTHGVTWRRTMHWRPAGMPDLSKLIRSTEDAITQAGLWRDDARVVEFARVAKVFPNEDRDALSDIGARICIWTVPAW